MRSMAVCRWVTLVRAGVAMALVMCSGWTLVSAETAANHAVPTQHKASEEGWPDTRAGKLSSQWVEAFSTGEDAMRAFLKDNMAEEGLAQRSVPKRIEKYRTLRERYGKLVLVSIDKATSGEVKATLMASDASVHKFVFKVETKSPYKLISVGILETRHGSHFGFHH